VYGSLTLAFITGALIGRGKFGRLVTLIVLAAVGGYVAVSVLSPNVVDALATRLSTFQDLKSDDSAHVRQLIYAATPQLINDNPFGIGIGAQGRGNMSQNGKDLLSTNIDSGPLSVFLGLGWVGGLLYLFGMLMLQIRAIMIARRLVDAPMASTMAAAAIVPLGVFPFVNVLGLGAVLLWICLGYVLALELRHSRMLQSRSQNHIGVSPSSARRPAFARQVPGGRIG
jgi:hypothetical protein